jgi:ADP-ribosyltransferase exoenzyme
MDRCITGLSKCIGPKKAPGVCGTKWRRSEKVGKKKPEEKAFVARGLTDNEAIEACGEACVGCKGADAPFDLRGGYDPNEPRDPAGKWTDAGGGDDDLGSMALGGEDRFSTPSTRKVDALRDEMGITEADVPFEQRQALDMYTADSTGFNKLARGGYGTDSAEIENLDTLVNSHELPHDVTVYRTVGWQRTKNILDHVGDTFSDPAFMSTTLDKSKIDKPGSYIEIQVPKGSHAFPVGSLSNFPEEAEILFPRDSRLQIISHEPRSENTERFVARLVS